MIKLSDRLNLMASQIKNNETMVDIGCDHGFLPFYLIEQGISPKVILGDISKGALEKARANYRNILADSANQNLGSKVFFRLGSGLSVVDKCEVDKAVIAGMGGELICEILNNDIDKSKDLKSLILQPRNKIEILRKWLYLNGFQITKEILVREGKFICEIIVSFYQHVAIEPDFCEKKLLDYDVKFKYPDLYSVNKFEDNFKHEKVFFSKELLVEYLNNKLEVEEYILAKLKEARSVDIRRVEHQNNIIKRIKFLLGGAYED